MSLEFRTHSQPYTVIDLLSWSPKLAPQMKKNYTCYVDKAGHKNGSRPTVDENATDIVSWEQVAPQILVQSQERGADTYTFSPGASSS